MQKKHSIANRMLLGLFIACLVGCQPTNLSPDNNTDTILMKGTEIPIPFQVGIFARSVIKDNSPTLLSAYYFLEKGGDTVTSYIHVYEKDGLTLEEKFESLKNAIQSEDDDPEFRFIAAYDVPLSQGEKLYQGKKGFFRMSDHIFANIYLFEYGDYFVEYYTDFPRDLEREAEAFVNDFAWSSETPAQAE